MSANLGDLGGIESGSESKLAGQAAPGPGSANRRAPLAPSAVPQRRPIGRPIAYTGDPEASHLTKKERHCLKRRAANRESARRVRARRQAAAEGLQELLESTAGHVSLLTAQLQQANEDRTALVAQISHMQDRLQAASEGRSQHIMQDTILLEATDLLQGHSSQPPSYSGIGDACLLVPNFTPVLAPEPANDCPGAQAKLLRPRNSPVGDSIATSGPHDARYDLYGTTKCEHTGATLASTSCTAPVLGDQPASPVHPCCDPALHMVPPTSAGGGAGGDTGDHSSSGFWEQLHKLSGRVGAGDRGASR